MEEMNLSSVVSEVISEIRSGAVAGIESDSDKTAAVAGVKSLLRRLTESGDISHEEYFAVEPLLSAQTL